MRPLHTAAAALALAAALATAGGAARADTVTLQLTGSVGQATFDPADPWAGAAAPGAPFRAEIRFDTLAPDADPSPQVGSYSASGPGFGVATFIGPLAMPPMSHVSIGLVDGVDGGPDQYTLYAFEGTADGLDDYLSLSILMQDDSGSALSGDAWRAPEPELVARFALRQFTLSGRFTDATGALVQHELQGTLAVPEPASVGLVGLALLGGAAAGLRACRQRRGISPRTER